MTKLINIADDVYKNLKQMKGKESYSYVIRKLLKTKTNKEKILSFFGVGGIDEKKIKELDGMWKKWSEEYA